jgi:hypothetical protein
VTICRVTPPDRSYHERMSWRCPHCSTPQAEASRCWVCHRSSTSCGTCRHFRQSVASRVGYCGLDRRHEPLRGDEVRACWEDAAAAVEPDPAIPGLLDLLAEPLPAPSSVATTEHDANEPAEKRRETRARDWDELPV